MILVNMLAMLMMPMVTVFVFRAPVRNPGFMATTRPMGMFMFFVNLNCCLVNMTTVRMMIMAVVLVVKMIHMPFAHMPTLLTMLMCVLLVMRVVRLCKAGSREH